MLEKIKKLLGIMTDEYDDVICDSMDEARAELVRSGVSMSAAHDDSPLICSAVKTYCLWQHSVDIHDAERYERSFMTQLDNIRKTPGYKEE